MKPLAFPSLALGGGNGGNGEVVVVQERLPIALGLSIVGGFLDIYTYLYRGQVFANAVTGNMVLLGLALARRDWPVCGQYLLAIGAYAFGILVAEAIRQRMMDLKRKISFHQMVLLLELAVLLIVWQIPGGRWDDAVNALIAFVCALQVQTFRKVHGLPFASTMCTGNLRSGTEALFRRLHDGKKNEWGNALRYYSIILGFISGAVLGATLLPSWGETAFLLAPGGLLLVFVLIWRQNWRRAPRGSR